MIGPVIGWIFACVVFGIVAGAIGDAIDERKTAIKDLQTKLDAIKDSIDRAGRDAR